MKVLYISSSPMGEKSNSRNLSKFYLDLLKSKHQNLTIIERDLSKTPVPHLDIQTLGAFMTPQDKRESKANELAKLSDALIKELNIVL